MYKMSKHAMCPIVCVNLNFWNTKWTSCIFHNTGKTMKKGTIQAINMVDEPDYQEWTHKHVLIWLKVLVLRAKFENSTCQNILKEFNKMLVNGKILEKYKEMKNWLMNWKTNCQKRIKLVQFGDKLLLVCSHWAKVVVNLL